MVIAKKIWVPSARELQREEKFVHKTLESIGEETLKELIAKACQARAKTYSPYSHYPVGAAVLTKSGHIYAGTNTENVNYSLTVHAEQNALGAAVMAGEHQKEQKFVRVMVVVTDSKSKVQPCGGCRQAIAEYCDNAVVISANTNGSINVITSLQTILPLGFTPAALGK